MTSLRAGDFWPASHPAREVLKTLGDVPSCFKTLARGRPGASQPASQPTSQPASQPTGIFVLTPPSSCFSPSSAAPLHLLPPSLHSLHLSLPISPPRNFLPFVSSYSALLPRRTCAPKRIAFSPRRPSKRGLSLVPNLRGWVAPGHPPERFGAPSNTYQHTQTASASLLYKFNSAPAFVPKRCMPSLQDHLYARRVSMRDLFRFPFRRM